MSGHLRAENLVAAHPGHGGEPVDRKVPVAGGGAQQQAELFVGQRDAFDALQGPLPWRPRQEGDVAGDEPSTLGVSQRTPDDEVD